MMYHRAILSASFTALLVLAACSPQAPVQQSQAPIEATPSQASSAQPTSQQAAAPPLSTAAATAKDAKSNEAQPGATTAMTTPAPGNQSALTKVTKTDTEWLKQLGPTKYNILRQSGTERAFTHEFWKKEPSDGSYRCAGCGAKLFDGNSKFISECGWPAFDKSIPGAIKYIEDNAYGMKRVETRCATCDGHLGHIFEDGPTDTGQRYCINGLAIDYEDKKKE